MGSRAGMLLIPVLISFLLFGCGLIGSFPDDAAVDELFAKLAAQSGKPECYDQAKELLASIKNPSGEEQERLAERATLRLAVFYLETRDEGVLKAMDRTRVEGGFSRLACNFYVIVLQSDEARARYSSSGCKALRRCSGVSFLEEFVKTGCID